MGVLLSLIAAAMLPPNVDRQTGRIMPDPGRCPAVRAGTRTVLSVDSIRATAYALGADSVRVFGDGIDLGEDESKVWFLAMAIRGDTVIQEFLYVLDRSSTPGVDTVAVRRDYAVSPEVRSAVHTEEYVMPVIRVVSPVSRTLEADSVHGMRRWWVHGSSCDLDAGPSVWVTERDSCRIARFDPSADSLTEWPDPAQGMPVGIHAAGDTVWYTSPDGYLGRLVPAANEFAAWEVPGSGFWGVGWPGLDRDHDGKVWLTRRRDEHFLARVEIGSQNVAKFDMWALPDTVADGPCDLIVDQEGKVWYSVMGVDSNYQVGRVGRLDPESGTLTEWELPSEYPVPYYLELDAGGNCWFVECDSNRVGRVDPYRNVVSELTPPLLGEALTYDLALDGQGDVWFTHGAGCVVRLISATGIGEQAGFPGLSYPRRSPSVGRGAAMLTADVCAGPAVLLDAMGRRVMKLRPGENDVRHLAPGIYFMLVEAGSDHARLKLVRGD